MHYPVPKDRQLCREVFAGAALLTQLLSEFKLAVGTPMEAYARRPKLAGKNRRQSKLFRPSHDLFNKFVQRGLMTEILIGLYFYLHFAVPCGSWGRANTLNHGTRSRAKPEGDGSLQRELDGNVLADVVASFCWALVSVGAHFSIENPSDSYLWQYPSIKALVNRFHFVVFDQCQFGLQLPGAPNCTYCKKSTAILTSVEQLMSLSRRCGGVTDQHMHETAWGSRRVDGVCVRLSAAAGQYPYLLCRSWAACIADARKRRIR